MCFYNSIILAESDEYTGLPSTVSFAGCENEKCVTVSTVDDDVVGGDRTIVISGTVSEERIKFNGTSVITIKENDGMCKPLN